MYHFRSHSNNHTTWPAYQLTHTCTHTVFHTHTQFHAVHTPCTQMHSPALPFTMFVDTPVQKVLLLIAAHIFLAASLAKCCTSGSLSPCASASSLPLNGANALGSWPAALDAARRTLETGSARASVDSPER